MICVDNYQAPFRNMKMSHLISDKNDKQELLEFGEKIGLKKEWLQEKSIYIHFDISESKRQQAIKAGAKEITCLGLGKIINKFIYKRN